MKKLTVISAVAGALADILTVVPNLDLLCVWQSDTAKVCEKYAKPYFDAKHLEKGLNRCWLNFWCHFFSSKNCPFWPILDAALLFYIKPLFNTNIAASRIDMKVEDEQKTLLLGTAEILRLVIGY